jgi:hypothetical protein
MTDSPVWRTPREDLDARGPAPGKGGAPGDRLDRAPLAVNELLRGRYRHHLATGFTPDLAIVLAEWDVAGYLRVTGATGADRRDRP